MILRKMTTDRRIFRTFTKFLENKTKSYCLEFKIEGNVQNSVLDSAFAGLMEGK